MLGWQEQALCAQTDPEAFFPEKGGSTREAKRICVGCEVKQRVPGVRPDARRALRHLGRAVRARAPPAQAPGRLTAEPRRLQAGSLGSPAGAHATAVPRTARRPRPAGPAFRRPRSTPHALPATRRARARPSDRTADRSTSPPSSSRTTARAGCPRRWPRSPRPPRARRRSSASTPAAPTAAPAARRGLRAHGRVLDAAARPASARRSPPAWRADARRAGGPTALGLAAARRLRARAGRARARCSPTPSTRPSAAVLGPKVARLGRPAAARRGRRSPPTRPATARPGWSGASTTRASTTRVRDVLAVGTAGALVRRDVWDALGGLDPLLPLFRDDLDLGWRVNAAGHRVVVVPTRARAARPRRARPGTAAARDRRPARQGIDRRNALLRPARPRRRPRGCRARLPRLLRRHRRCGCWASC